MSASVVSPPSLAGRSALLSRLDGHPALGHIGPNWFASVMGTGIVAVAAVTLPVRVPGLPAFATAVWGLDALLLVVVVTATVLHWRHHPAAARGHLDSPVMSHFYGAPAMALMVVGTGTLVVGSPVVGPTHAVAVDAVLWSAGTTFGLWTAVAVPRRMLTRHGVSVRDAFGGWLMPVVPPMVSAATGALLVPHLPAGWPRTAMLTACYALFASAVAASVVVVALVGRRLVRHGAGAAAAVPTLWIVLGPAGQSITASHSLGQQTPDGSVLRAAGVAYGVPVWGLAMAWLVVAAVVTARTAHRHLPFSLTWWSFTFPVGTLVTGTSSLAAATGATLWVVMAALLYAGLVAAWVVVAARTAHGAWTGQLLRAPAG